MGLLKKVPRKVWSFLDFINELIPKKKKKIFLYSNLGFRDNVKALYDYLIANDYQKEYEIVCSLNDYREQPPVKGVAFVSNLRGLFSFFTSRYVFYCFGKYPIKPKKDQVVFNLWHGMPLKKIGNLIEGCEKIDYNYFTHLLCTSEFFRKIMKDSFRCLDSQIVICGQPRTDEMMKSNWKKPGKLLLWMPTFREENTGKSELDLLTQNQWEQLDEMCQQAGWKLMIKLHPWSTLKEDAIGKLNCIFLMNHENFQKKYKNLYTLLAQADCLITDYSSVFFDYLLLDRPMGFAVSDWKAYSADRGFTLENPLEYLPGACFEDGEGMLSFVREILEGTDRWKEKRRELNHLFNQYQDGENCRRVLEIAGIGVKNEYHP